MDRRFCIALSIDRIIRSRDTMWVNRRYRLVYLKGYFIDFQVFIDGNGDAEGNFTVVALLDDKEMNGTLQMSMQPVGYFQYQLNCSNSETALPVNMKSHSITQLHTFLFSRNLNTSIMNVPSNGLAENRHSPNRNAVSTGKNAFTSSILNCLRVCCLFRRL